MAAAGLLAASAAEAFHIVLLPEGHFGRRRLMNNSSIVRLRREVIVLSGAQLCFLNNLAI
jgi:hypothetical protein